MTQRRQLLVRHRALDPTAWTALHALERDGETAGAEALARAVLWEFEWAGDEEGARRLEEWVASANWFANPNRDRATWRGEAGDPTEMEAGAARADGTLGSGARGAYLVTAWRGALAAPAHEAAATAALGSPVRVRRGLVWWLGSDERDAQALLENAGARASGGLLVNPHSQAGRACAMLPVPALAEWADEDAGRSST